MLCSAVSVHVLVCTNSRVAAERFRDGWKYGASTDNNQAIITITHELFLISSNLNLS